MAQIGDEAVKKATGRGWAEWFRIFDKAGAAKLDHRGIAAIAEEHGAPPWWGQMVTVRYEQERGLREVHQKMDGYSASISRTIAAPAEEVYEAWADGRRRAKWLKTPKVVVRKATPHKSLRITWSDGTSSVEVNLYPKGDAKTQVAVQHNKLEDAAAVGEKKAFWAEALDRLKEEVG